MVSVAECPVDAIKPDTEPDAAEWVEFNRKYSEQWPNITIRRDPLPDADKMEDEIGKFEKFFSDKPGEGLILGSNFLFIVLQTFLLLVVNFNG